SGAFFHNDALFNTRGRVFEKVLIQEVLDKIRTFAPAPCPATGCTQDWVDIGATIDVARWYHSMQALSDDQILMVGGSKEGGLVLNTPRVNEPSYEISIDGHSLPAVPFPYFEFTNSDGPGKSYNVDRSPPSAVSSRPLLPSTFIVSLYPARKILTLLLSPSPLHILKVHLMPNTPDHVFTIIGNQVFIYDYISNKNIITPPFLPNPRTFPSSASSVLLPLKAFENCRPEVMVCGGSSGDAPNPKALDDGGRIHPLDTEPEWTFEQLPDGPRTMGDAFLLPHGNVFIVNGILHVGLGTYMNRECLTDAVVFGASAYDPAFTPLLYKPDAPVGERFTIMPASTIPRLYHSVAALLPIGECFREHQVPEFFNAGGLCSLHQQQKMTFSYPTEYRVEIFSPPYMSAPNRPVIASSPEFINYNTEFTVNVQGAVIGEATIVLSHHGFSTHGVHHGQSMIELTTFTTESGVTTVTSPPSGSVMPPGIYLLFATVNGIPSEAAWVRLNMI
ncbi:hypothetical protein BDK51DRAFT_41229, partial [Blyttiomyces helicus]